MVENSPFDLEGGSGSRLDELELEGLEAGLAIKNPPKKPTKNVFLFFFILNFFMKIIPTFFFETDFL
jgi:hypothetical protein